MISFYDYIFYKTYNAYEKIGETASFFYAEGVVVILQGFLLLDIYTLLTLIFMLPTKSIYAKYIGLAVSILLYIINHKRYKKCYKEIITFFNNKQNKKSSKLIIFIILTSILFPLIF